MKEFHSGLDAVWAELARQLGADVRRASTVMNATMCTIRGMIAQTTIKDDPAYFSELLAYCKRQVARELELVTPAVVEAPVAPPADLSRRRRAGGRP